MVEPGGTVAVGEAAAVASDDDGGAGPVEPVGAG